MALEIATRRGWEVLRLASESLAAEILPGRGGDVLSLRSLPHDVELLFQTPWGLRQRGAVPTAGGSVANLMESYPGGWQTVFPNGGDAVVEQGVEWGMHGEAWLAPWDWTAIADGVELTTRLVRSPFELTKRFVLRGDALSMQETVRHVGGHAVEVMWSHHPAFGDPLIAGGCRIETGAHTFVVDDERRTAGGDLEVGATSSWPLVPGRAGGLVDVSWVPDVDESCDRLGYLTDLDRGLVSLVNGGLDIAVDVEWDAAVFPCAWLWLEARGTPGFPWYQGIRALGIEPATSWPAQGLSAVRDKTGTQLILSPGDSRTVEMCLRVRSAAATR